MAALITAPCALQDANTAPEFGLGKSEVDSKRPDRSPQACAVPRYQECSCIVLGKLLPFQVRLGLKQLGVLVGVRRGAAAQDLELASLAGLDAVRGPTSCLLLTWAATGAAGWGAGCWGADRSETMTGLG